MCWKDAHGVVSSAMGVDLSDAARRFREANPGQQPTRAAQLKPFMKWPASDEAVQKLLDRIPAGKL